MIKTRTNASPILRNPSQRREGLGLICLQIRSVGGHLSGTFTNPSRGRVKDLGGRKSINNKYISLSSINTSRYHAHARALRVRTREGVCDGFEGRIYSEPPAQRNPIGPRLRTFAPCGVLFPPLDKYAIVARSQTRANVAYPRAIPPVVGTWREAGKNRGRGNSHAIRHSFI